MLAAAVVSFTLFHYASCYFLFGGVGILKNDRVDPIVSPDGLSAHGHQFFGSSAIQAARQTSEQLRAGLCTSIPIVEDKSAYWRPHVYFARKDGTFTTVNGGPTIYYHFNEVDQIFPDNFMMLAGDASSRTCPYIQGKKARDLPVNYLCLGDPNDGKNDYDPTYSQFPPVDCSGKIRMQINYPSCWTGKTPSDNNYTPEMAYPTEAADRGPCPNGYIKLPRIFMEIYLDTPDFSGMWDQALNPKQPFVLGNGDTLGCSYHADYAFGWEKGVLEKVVAECEECMGRDYGSTKCCEAKGILHTDGEAAGNCHATPQVDERLIGVFDQLPGYNPVQGLPAPVKRPDPKFLSPMTQYDTDNAPAGSCTLSDPNPKGFHRKRAGQCQLLDVLPGGTANPGDAAPNPGGSNPSSGVAGGEGSDGIPARSATGVKGSTGAGGTRMAGAGNTEETIALPDPTRSGGSRPTPTDALGRPSPSDDTVSVDANFSGASAVAPPMLLAIAFLVTKMF